MGRIWLVNEPGARGGPRTKAEKRFLRERIAELRREGERADVASARAYKEMRARRRPARKKIGGNPSRKGGRTVAKRKARPRYKSGPKKGLFMSNRAIAAQKAARKKKRNPPKKNTTTKRRRRRTTTKSRSRTRRRAPVAKRKKTTRRRRRRRNPPMKLMDRIVSGLGGGLIVTGAEAVTRISPTLFRQPQSSTVGMSIQLAVATLTAMLMERAFPRRQAAAIATAAAFGVPMQTMLLRFVAPRAPMLTAALVPTLSSYSRPNRAGMRGLYSRRALPTGSPARSRGVRGYDYAAGIW